MTLYTDLQDLGLTANQSQIYLTLARAGISSAGSVIKKTGMHRNLVYVGLQELVEKKLVTVSKVRNVAHYKLLSPARLLDEPQEKERLAENIIEEVRLLTKKATSGQEIVVYEGADEFRRYEEQLYYKFKPKSLIRYLGISPAWQEVVGEKLENALIDVQKNKQVHMRALTNKVTSGQQRYVDRADGFVEIRTNPLVSSTTNNTVILNDRISIRSFLEPYFVVEVVNTELARNYQNYFDVLWKQSRG